MSLVKDLLRIAYEDTELLRSLDAKGDVFSRPRNVDFLLMAPTQEKAEVAASFVNDNCYGTAVVQESDGDFGVLVTVHMPIEQNIVNSVSALMLCLCHLFGLDYDGWGCEVQRDI